MSCLTTLVYCASVTVKLMNDERLIVVDKLMDKRDVRPGDFTGKTRNYLILCVVAFMGQVNQQLTSSPQAFTGGNPRGRGHNVIIR